MTLIVTLGTPDGIVIAGDSLSTMMANKLIEGDFNVQCPQCSTPHSFRGRLPNVYSLNTLSHAQKIFPFMDIYGIGTFGLGHIAGKTIYFALREFEQDLRSRGQVIGNPSELANLVGERIQNLILEQFRQEMQNSEYEIQEGIYPIGFQIVGYENDKPTRIELRIGRDIKIILRHDLGITYTGQEDVVNALFARFNSNPAEQPVFQYFSLQDAIIYAEFLIKTTEIYQRFSSNMATVGGEIDIALITPFDGFRWVKQKSLQAKMSGGLHA